MIENLKKIELHLHLDGSVRVSTIEELLDKNDLEKELVVDENTKSLTDYLKKFDLPIKVMQSKENLIRISKELCEDLISIIHTYSMKICRERKNKLKQIENILASSENDTDEKE